MTAPDIPVAARTLHRRLVDAGWSIAGPRHGAGEWGYNSLSEVEDGNGRRKRVEVVEQVESVLIRACHVDRRAIVAMWVRRPGRGWALDTCWRGRHDAEHAPSPMTATQLRTYVAAPDAHAALAAIEPTIERSAA